MYLKVNSTNNFIHLDFNGTVYSQSILKKIDKGYLIEYTTSNGNGYVVGWVYFKIYIRKWIERIKRDNPFERNRKENIYQVSPEFYKIFREAAIIHQLGFKDSLGMIFRKALEFIIKDFLKDYFPKTFEDIISKKTIRQIFCYFCDIKNNQIKIKEKEKFSKIQEKLQALKSLANIINNTFKIGNDFSHYERQLTKFSVENMQERIIKIVDFINEIIKIDRMVSKQKKLNAEFDADKLNG